MAITIGLIPKAPASGFTLAELLISLAILGVIATFTIPKILSAQQNKEWNAKTKELIATVSGAYSMYTRQNGFNPTTCMRDIMLQTNYIKQTQSGEFEVDGKFGGVNACNLSGQPCYRFASGAVLFHSGSTANFGAGTTQNWVDFVIDPDGTYNNQKPLRVLLFYDGRITTYEDCPAGAMNSSAFTCNPPSNPAPGSDPTWFDWN